MSKRQAYTPFSARSMVRPTKDHMYMITEWSLYGHSIKASRRKIIGTSIEATAGQLLHEISISTASTTGISDHAR